MVKPISLGWDIQVTKYQLLSKGKRLWSKTSDCYTRVGLLINYLDWYILAEKKF